MLYIYYYYSINEFTNPSFLLLCAGSCAELIGLIVYLNEIKYYEKEIKITIIDHESKWKSMY